MQSPRSEFPTTWGRLTRLITVSAVGLAFGVSAYILVLGAAQLSHARSVGTLMIVVAVADILLMLKAAALAPGGYFVTPREIVVRRILGSVRIPLSDVTDVRSGGDILKGVLWLGGSGGLFGFFGKFRRPGMGTFMAYATRLDRLVLIERGNATPIVLSPDEPERFVEEVSRVLSDGDPE